MSKNLMPEIAKLLGVEMGEAFYINDHLGRRVYAYSDNNLFKIGPALLHLNNTDGCFEGSDRDQIILVKLLAGLLTIEKLPWEPKEDEQFYRPNIICKAVSNELWSGSTLNYSLKLLGMVYRTREEAEAHLAEDYERLTGNPFSRLE